MFRHVATATNGTPTCTFQGNHIDFGPAFQRITMVGSLAGKDRGQPTSWTRAGRTRAGELRERLRGGQRLHGVEVTSAMGKGKLIDELFSELVQPEGCIQPTFVMLTSRWR